MNKKYSFKAPVEAYYLITFVDGSQKLLLLEIGKEYTYQELEDIAQIQQVSALESA